MIFDSHAHFSRYNFNNEFDAWRYDGNDYIADRFTRESMFLTMRREGIIGFIEPSVNFESIPAQIELARKYPDFIRIAVGVHPTRCFLTEWKNRKYLEGYLREGDAVAVGETGLDYHYPRLKQHRLTQKRWFIYQIKLANALELPLILHIRKADRDALKILKKNKSRLHGGVAHCFTGDHQVADEYISLGFSLGIGGKILNGDEDAEKLCRAVQLIPLDKILIETDAPYLAPETAGADLQPKKRQKIRNSSLILRAVAEKIALIKGISADDVERITTENGMKLFGISFGGENDV